MKKNKCITGKRELEKIYNFCHKYLLVAVDSDYDYLCENNSPYAITMCNNPFVLHTFSHAKESVIYSVEYIDFILSKLCLYKDYSDFSSDFFFKSISNIIYPLFVDKLYEINNLPLGNYHSSKNKIEELNSIFENILNIIGDNEGLIISDECKVMDGFFELLRDKVSLYPLNVNLNEIDGFITYLNKKGLNKDNVYRFIKGHTLEDKLIYPFLRCIHEKRKKYESDNIPDYEGKQKGERIGQVHNHFNKNCDISTLLHSHMENIKYNNDLIFSNIKDKIDKLAVI